MKITNSKNLKILSWDNFPCDLSDQVFEILDDNHPSHTYKYGKNDKVRLIRLPQRGLKIGEHSFNEDYLVTCSVNAETAEFCGIEKSSLKIVDEKQFDGPK